MNIKDINIDIKDIISQYISIKKTGNKYFALCPFHDDRNPSLCIDCQRQFFYCFACRAAGDGIAFIMKFLSINFKDSLIELENKFNISLNYKKEKIDIYLSVMADAHKYYVSNFNKAYKYLYNRGVSLKTIQDLEIGFSDGKLLASYNESDLYKLGITDKQGKDVFEQRITFPIFDNNGNVRAFSARAIGDHIQPKYKNSKNNLVYNKSSMLYNMHNIDKSKDIFIVEGSLDQACMHEHGFKNSVAILGSNISFNQVKMLSRCTSKLFLMLDGDKAGRSATLEAVGRFIIYDDVDLRVCILKNNQDPADILLKNKHIAINKLIKSSLTIEEFINKITTINNTKKSLFLLKHILINRSNSKRRINLINIAASNLGVFYEDLLKMCDTYYLQKDGIPKTVEMVDKAIFALIYEPALCDSKKFRKYFEDEFEDKKMNMLRLLIMHHEKSYTSSYIFYLLRSNFDEYFVNQFCCIYEESPLWAQDFDFIMQKIIEERKKLNHINTLFKINEHKK